MTTAITHEGSNINQTSSHHLTFHPVLLYSGKYDMPCEKELEKRSVKKQMKQ